MASDCFGFFKNLQLQGCLSLSLLYWSTLQPTLMIGGLHDGPNLIVYNSFIKVCQLLYGVLQPCVMNHFIKIECWHLTRYLIVMSCAIQSNDCMTKVSSSSSYSSKLNLKLQLTQTNALEAYDHPIVCRGNARTPSSNHSKRLNDSPVFVRPKGNHPKTGWHGTLS